MKTSPLPVLIAGSPGPLRSALEALLHTLPWVQSVQVADTTARLLENIQPTVPAAEGQILVIMVLDTRQDFTADSALIRQRWPASRIAILTDESDQLTLVGGQNGKEFFDLILQQGARPEALIASIHRLVTHMMD